MHGLQLGALAAVRAVRKVGGRAREHEGVLVGGHRGELIEAAGATRPRHLLSREARHLDAHLHSRMR